MPPEITHNIHHRCQTYLLRRHQEPSILQLLHHTLRIILCRDRLEEGQTLAAVPGERLLGRGRIVDVEVGEVDLGGGGALGDVGDEGVDDRLGQLGVFDVGEVDIGVDPCGAVWGLESNLFACLLACGKESRQRQ